MEITEGDLLEEEIMKILEGKMKIIEGLKVGIDIIIKKLIIVILR